MGSTGPTEPWRPRQWSIHFWEGCDLFAWLRLLRANRCAVGLPYLYVAAAVSAVSFGHTVFRLLQDGWYRDRLRRAPMPQAPLFVLGHWRTGTTLLHELLVLDERHTYPNTYQCLEPNHFLLTERFVKRYLGFLVPQRRPMDNMAAGWDHPQEDEFALCMMGQPSPYLTIAFPNHGPCHQDYFDLETVPAKARAAWQRAFLGFLRRLSFRDPRRLVLKSPPHTCRVPLLLEMFPDARFVVITRDPYEVFPSTVNLWQSLYRKHGLQTPTFAGLDEYVYRTFLHFAERVEVARQRVPAGQFHELKYEDLLRDPLGELRRLYDGLGLGGFEQARPRWEEYLAQSRNYETNRYELAPATQAEITRRWDEVIRRQGYAIR